MKLKNIITTLFSQNIFDLIRFMPDWRSVVRMHFLHAASESGLLAALVTPSTKGELMQKLSAKRPELLDAIIDVGLSLGELSCRNGYYRLKGKRARSLIGRNGDVLSAFIEANVTYYNLTYRHFAGRLTGAPLANYLEEFGNVVARFSRMAEPYVRHFIDDIIRGKPTMRMLDIGCGSGVYLRSAVETNPNTTGIGIEIDEKVMLQARENLEHWGISKQCQVVAGDIRKLSPEISGTFDLITLNNIVYYFPPDERVPLFQTLRHKLSPDGTMAIISYFNSKGKDLAAANLNIATASLVDCTPLPELDDLKTNLTECGFRTIHVTKLIPRSTFYGIIAKVARK